MGKFKNLLLGAATLSLAVTGFAVTEEAQAKEFYEGKTITVLIGRPAGSGADLTVRSFLQYWGDLIPGKPKLVGKQLTGGGGKKIYNHIYKAKPDGLQMIFTPYNSIPQIQKQKSMRADFTKMAFVGGLTNLAMTYARTSVVKGRDDISNLKDGAKLGGQRPHHRFDLLGRVSLDLLGAKYNYTTGFKGSKRVYNSVLRGELDMQTVGLNVFSSYAVDSLVKPGKANALWYHPTPSASGGFNNLDHIFGDVPSFPDFYKKHTGKALSGDLFKFYQWMVRTLNGVSYVAMMPPGTPQAALDALRPAFAKVTKIEKYRVDQKKKFGFVLPYVDPAGGKAITGMLANIDPAIMATLNNYIATGKKRAVKSKKKK
jgi:tripartite-type tricarboxylate transporter receptor subunit TctC